MSKKSLSIRAKLNRAIKPGLFEGTVTTNKFSTLNQFRNYIAEGALLNISKIASNALSIPCGEYMVWVTDVGHTMLIPVGSSRRDTEVFENKEDQYEVETPKLLRNWNQIGMTLAEDNNEPPEEFKFKADTNYERQAMFRAMQNHGYGEDFGALAQEVGVDTPMISRVLSGDRNPSLALAARLCAALSSDPTALFPDIFDTRGKSAKPKKVEANSGSGMGGTAAGSRKKGKASKKWTQGNKSSSPVESAMVANNIIAELDSTLNKPMTDVPTTKSNVQQLNKKQEDPRNKLAPQIDSVETDLDKLSDSLERGQVRSVSSTEGLTDMQDQVSDIQTMLDKISAGL